MAPIHVTRHVSQNAAPKINAFLNRHSLPPDSFQRAERHALDFIESFRPASRAPVQLRYLDGEEVEAAFPNRSRASAFYTFGDKWVTVNVDRLIALLTGSNAETLATVAQNPDMAHLVIRCLSPKLVHEGMHNSDFLRTPLGPRINGILSGLELWKGLLAEHPDSSMAKAKIEAYEANWRIMRLLLEGRATYAGWIFTASMFGLGEKPARRNPAEAAAWEEEYGAPARAMDWLVGRLGDRVWEITAREMPESVAELIKPARYLARLMELGKVN